MTKIFPDEKFCPTKVLSDEVCPDKVIVFLKSVVTPSKMRTVINFYAKTFKGFPEKYFRGYCGFGFTGQITFFRIEILKIIETRIFILKLS